MKHFDWKLALRIGGSLLSVAILIYLFNKIGLAKTWEQIKLIAPWRLVVCLVLMAISRIAVWGRWHVLLQAQETKVAWQDSMRLNFAGLFASNVLPTTIGGDMARLAGAIRLGIDGTLAASSLVADRLLGLFGMALMLPFGLPLLFANLKELSGKGAAATGLGALWSKAIQAIRRVFDNFRYWQRNPLYLLGSFGFTLLHMLCYFLIIKLLIEGMGESLGLDEIAGIYSLKYFITLLPISINGIGLAEVTMTRLYSVLGGLSEPTAIIIGVLLRVLEVIGSLPGALFLSWVLAGNKNEQTAQNEAKKVTGLLPSKKRSNDTTQS